MGARWAKGAKVVGLSTRTWLELGICTACTHHAHRVHVQAMLHVHAHLSNSVARGAMQPRKLVVTAEMSEWPSCPPSLLVDDLRARKMSESVRLSRPSVPSLASPPTSRGSTLHT